MKKIFSLFFALLFTSLTSIPVFSAEKPQIDASGYVLMEQGSFSVLAEGNAHLPLAPASTTKIMTCLVVLEECAQDEMVHVTEEAVGVEGSSAYLRKGERLTVRELLLCLMLSSANDAAVALAIHVAGSVEQFVALMNQKAVRLSLESAHFCNPHGLYHENHRISAYDMAILTCYALENAAFREIVSTKSAVVGSGEYRRTLTNHNRLLYSLNGCIGVKTGYTIAAGRCLVSACERENTTLIVVTFGCRDDWDSHTALYEYGFQTVKRFTFDGYSTTLGIAGSKDTVEVYAPEYTILAAPNSKLTYSVYCPYLLYPPFERGEKVGFVAVSLDGNEIAKLPIVTAGDCPLGSTVSLLERLFRFILSLFD